jgi:hypothetical protein
MEIASAKTARADRNDHLLWSGHRVGNLPHDDYAWLFHDDCSHDSCVLSTGQSSAT